MVWTSQPTRESVLYATLLPTAPSHFRSRSRQIGVLDGEGGYKAPKEAVNLMPGDIGGDGRIGERFCPDVGQDEKETRGPYEKGPLSLLRGWKGARRQ